ncbi:hypothetical protein ASPACDRAFT_45080 [Aspergillus aculeatus ATCC 16872]|uniref:Carboxylic ester hydrolase n=1 Tax=Aspergillus aculeatus (strain ATCC 16872 / CBS 172.66 / WB 5094) TaxID=690307 RepID=A0A1L9WQW6_ASPA1|nr:uncharacterized protein ASPACDRAFT_45080 [Aspergillus aculeatus ATCC 16872]OJJ98572.1 hypothetical protein ASPACDRAFT_45080 [Aspergillus aculeatus ATCC 16872]
MYRAFVVLGAAATAAATALATTTTTTLEEACTTANAKAAIPADGILSGITFNTSSISVAVTKNSSVTGTDYPSAVIDYCSVTFSYSHQGAGDSVQLELWLPAPENFANRWLSTGGGAFAINSGSNSLPGGIIYGAAAGITDGGFGSFDNELDDVFPLGNGTANWPAVYMFGYQAHHELSVIGKAYARNFFNMTATDKLYSYYQGCSEGGREGWSQLQRFADEWDGAVTGAPAFRFSQQQINHMFPPVVEKTLGYYPPPCELEQIMYETIDACDALDGRSDGVVSRTDLCKLNFNLTSLVGTPYSCNVLTGNEPAQNGTITAEGVAVAETIFKGLHDSEGLQAYLSFQYGTSLDDATTTYDETTESWGLSTGVNGGTEWIARFIELQDSSNLDWSNFTYDTLRDYMYAGWQMYEDTLQTSWPDLEATRDAGVKILHFHGESDPSIPPASSVHYHESVRQILYPGLSFNASTSALSDWYRLFLIPGAAHCAVNPYQDGPWPQTNLATLIAWVEQGVVPERLNATYTTGADEGKSAEICAWPLRPLWSNNATTFDCVYDQASIDTWKYTFDSYKEPLY